MRRCRPRHQPGGVRRRHPGPGARAVRACRADHDLLAGDLLPVLARLGGNLVGSVHGDAGVGGRPGGGAAGRGRVRADRRPDRLERLAHRRGRERRAAPRRPVARHDRARLHLGGVRSHPPRRCWSPTRTSRLAPRRRNWPGWPGPAGRPATASRRPGAESTDDRCGLPVPLDVDGDPAAADRIAALGVTEVSLAAAYHAVRAVTPFHPGHRVVTRDAAAYYRPDSGPLARRAAAPGRAGSGGPPCSSGPRARCTPPGCG